MIWFKLNVKISSELHTIDEDAFAHVVVSLVDSTQENIKHWSAKPTISIFEDVILNKWYKHNYTVRVNNYDMKEEMYYLYIFK